MIKSIQLAVDGSTQSDVATDYALELAQHLEATLDVVYVINQRHFNVPHISQSGVLVYTDDENIRNLYKQKGEYLLKRSQERAVQRGLVSRTECRLGDPALEILATANDCDLILLGKRGESQLEPSPALGSVVMRVLQMAQQPVLVTPETFMPIKRLVLGYDGSNQSRLVMNYACELAHRLDLPLLALSAHKDKAIARQRLEVVERYASALNIDFSYKPLAGNPAEAILKEISENDLIAVGAYGKRGIRKWLLGSTSQSILRDTSQAVLIHR